MLRACEESTSAIIGSSLDFVFVYVVVCYVHNQVDTKKGKKRKNVHAYGKF